MKEGDFVEISGKNSGYGKILGFPSVHKVMVLVQSSNPNVTITENGTGFSQRAAGGWYLKS
jgi:hypothetical protein